MARNFKELAHAVETDLVRAARAAQDKQQLQDKIGNDLSAPLRDDEVTWLDTDLD